MPKRRILKLTVVIALAILLITLLSSIIVTNYIERTVLSQLQQRVQLASKGLYVASADETDVSIFSSSIRFTNLLLAPSRPVTEGSAVILRSEHLEIQGFSLLAMLRSKELISEHLIVDSAQITLYKAKLIRPVNPDSVLADMSVDLPPGFKKLFFEKVDINHSHFSVMEGFDDSIQIFSSQDASFRIEEFEIAGNEGEKEDARMFSSKKFSIEMERFSFHFPSDLYTLYGRSLSGSYLDSTLVIDSLQLIPLFEKEEFIKKADDQVSRIQAMASQVSLEHVDLQSFFETTKLRADLMTVTQLSLDIYRDNNMPIKPIVKPSMQALLQDLPLLIKIDTILVTDGTVYYEELAEDSKVTTTMFLDKLRCKLTGLSNDTASYTSKSSMKAEATAMFMGKARYSTNLEFPLTTRDEFFYCSGSIESADMNIINPLMEKSKHVKIASGRMDTLEFSFVAGPSKSEGKMKFLYKDFKIEMLNPEGKESGGKEKFRTFVANTVMMKANNPEPGKEPRITNIGVERFPYRYFFYYMMQSITSGIGPAVQGEQKTRLLKIKNK